MTDYSETDSEKLLKTFLSVKYQLHAVLHSGFLIQASNRQSFIYLTTIRISLGMILYSKINDTEAPKVLRIYSCSIPIVQSEASPSFAIVATYKFCMQSSHGSRATHYFL